MIFYESLCFMIAYQNVLGWFFFLHVCGIYLDFANVHWFGL